MPGTDATTEQLAGTPVTVPVWSLLVPVALAVLLVVIAQQRPDGRLHVWMLDVGQGDAIFVRTPAGHTALIDGGPEATPLLNGIGEHMPFWRHDIDLVVLTHPHQDHLMGLVEALERYAVDQVVQTAFTATSGVQAEWLRTLDERRVPVRYAGRGDAIGFEGEPDVTLRVLSPLTPDAGQEGSGNNVNNTSLVLRLSYGKQDIFLSGDAQGEAESAIVRREGVGIASEVLKVGHHGSDTSSTPRFLEAVMPRVAIISVGEGNRFDHPAAATLQALDAVGARVYRTDLDGTVEIVADTEKMWVSAQRGSER